MAIQNLPESQLQYKNIYTLLSKTTKTFNKFYITQAINLHELAVKDAEIDKLTVKKKRTKVAADPNTDFTNLESIKEAMDKAKEQQDTWDKKDRARETAA